MTPEEMREIALRLANEYERALSDWVEPEVILTRAQAYYEFLKES